MASTKRFYALFTSNDVSRCMGKVQLDEMVFRDPEGDDMTMALETAGGEDAMLPVLSDDLGLDMMVFDDVNPDGLALF